jgi:hypothetical protein
MLQLARLRDARSAKRKSTIANFRVSGFQRRRERELDASTCEVASSEKCQREVMHRISLNRENSISTWMD